MFFNFWLSFEERGRRLQLGPATDLDSNCVQCAMQTFDHENNITAHDSGPQVGVGNTMGILWSQRPLCVKQVTEMRSPQKTESELFILLYFIKDQTDPKKYIHLFSIAKTSAYISGGILHHSISMFVLLTVFPHLKRTAPDLT